MLNDLPEQCLIAADAGFVGYELAAEILRSGAQIVMRVGSNVRLLKKLGSYRESGGLVYLWPDKIARKKLPPLVFRLVVMQGPRHPIYLITSVLETDVLSDAEVIEIYKARWTIEITQAECVSRTSLYNSPLEITVSTRALLKLATICQQFKANSIDSDLSNLHGGDSCPLFPPANTQPEPKPDAARGHVVASARGLESSAEADATTDPAAIGVDDQSLAGQQRDAASGLSQSNRGESA